ncbi:small s protein [Colletotrichum karsti]|uniref:Small s protein n=1 Tax=Colletotrichum karsti TaxID=1095194 RepID=A0A9P6IEI8_9PEZI|nr:small s protein [Colletotrichum karsti]KAF9880927.1 small s protein [Colletotrichum karsti]
MDPISAFSFAVNILTVVDISAKLISTASEIRSSGDTVSNKELAADAQRLKSYCQKFSLETATKSSQQNATSSISSEDDATLRLLASEAKGIADDIQDNLLKLNKQRSFMRVFRQSIRNTRKQPEMKCKAERLKEMQDKIIFSIIVSLHSSVGTLTLKDDAALARLDENTRSLIQTILSGNDTTRAKIETQMASLHTDIAKNHVEMMGSSGQRHDELLSAIRVGPTQHEAPERESAAEHKERVTRSILDKLWFSRIKDRYEDIKPAHQKTFEWIFSAEAQMESSCSFYRWIEQGSGLYWISGKAGTGKSTLMKFLADHERTKALLQHWTKGQEYVTANYWFWDQSQDPLQKSMEGLYRGLLYDVISKETSLAPLLFPDQFIPERQWQLEFPTPNGLRRAFNRLVSMEASTVLVVLLIDGLDEYEATEIEQLSLSESLKAAAQSHHMKIIASSRPETVFENAFKDCDKLYLHELTYSDQTSFTKDSLYKHERMQYLASLPGGKEDAAELIRSAAKKSEGIFLWLRLVVDSLVQELDACDVIKDLQHETSSFTPWERMLQTAIDLQVVSIKGAEQLSDMLTMFIKGGADLRVVTHVRRCDDLVAIEGFGVPDDQQVNPEYLKHDPLVVQDVVRYAFLHGNLPALMSRPFSVLREFVPFQDLDACWGTSMHEWRWQAEGLYLVGSDPANVKRADEKAIRELGHRLLELIHVSGNADSKVVEDLDNNEQEQ